MNDISDLLKENNESIMTDGITTFIVRVKTLNIIHQVVRVRNAHLICLLYNAN